MDAHFLLDLPMISGHVRQQLTEILREVLVPHIGHLELGNFVSGPALWRVLFVTFIIISDWVISFAFASGESGRSFQGRIF
jgi:hypothetical protein